MKNALFNQLAGTIGNLVGRRNLVRAGEYLARAGRRDMPNSLSTNGEQLVQERVLESLGGRPCTVVDCGANRGHWTRQLSELNSSLGNTSGRVYCFEPSPFTFERLSERISSLNTSLEIMPVNKALSSSSGTMELKVVSDGAGTNSLVEVPGKYSETETIETTTLDQFAEAHALQTIDLLKVDAEGYDMEVLLGAEGLIARQAIGVMQFEYNWRWIFGRHYLRDVFTLAEKYGYRVGKVTHKGIELYGEYDVRLESFIESNYVAVAEDWLNRLPTHGSWLE